MLITITTAALLASCTVTDGDTIRCGDERIRLLAIDAPEMGECPRGRTCVPGSGPLAKVALQRAVQGRRLTIDRVGTDAYGRTLGVVYADGEDLSCVMLAAGQAVYVARWDNGGRVARDCRAARR